jgi:hypothetical protein
MAYIGNSPGVASQRIVTTFTATSNQTTFTPQSGYTVGYIDVYHNGVRLVNGDDYTASNGTTVVLASGAAADDVVETVAYLPRGLSDGYTKTEADGRYAQRSNNLSDLGSASTARTNLDLGNVENKSSETIRGEITSGNVTTGLGYTPVNKAGDTMTGQLNLNYGNPRISMSDTGGSGRSINIGHWDGANNRVETNAAQLLIAMYGAHNFRVENNTNGGSFTMDSFGRVTMPNQPMCFVTRISTQESIGNSDGSPTDLVLNTEIFNVGGHFNSGNSRWTAPVTGKYEFSWSYATYSGFPSVYRTYLWLNGTRLSYTQLRNDSTGNSGNYNYASRTAILALAQNDYVVLRASIDSYSTWYADSNLRTALTVKLIG